MSGPKWAVSKRVRFDDRVEVREEPLGLMVALVETKKAARLVAGAPELAAALAELLEHDRCVCDEQEACGHHAARVRARAALAAVGLEPSQ